MRTTHLGTKVQEEFTGLVDAASVGGGVLGGGVLAYRPYSIPSAASSDMTPDHDVRLLDHDGRYSPACHNTATWQTAGVFGGAVLGDYHPVEVLPGFRFDLAVTAVWGHRYPNVSVVAVVAPSCELAPVCAGGIVTPACAAAICSGVSAVFMVADWR